MIDFTLTPQQEELRQTAKQFAVDVMIPAAEKADRVVEPDRAFDWDVIREGSAPTDGLLRLLVVDFARLDTSFPDFICWPRFVERIDTSVRLLVSEIGGPLPYDVVLPARLGHRAASGLLFGWEKVT